MANPKIHTNEPEKLPPTEPDNESTQKSTIEEAATKQETEVLKGPVHLQCTGPYPLRDHVSGILITDRNYLEVADLDDPKNSWLKRQVRAGVLRVVVPPTQE